MGHWLKCHSTGARGGIWGTECMNPTMLRWKSRKKKYLGDKKWIWRKRSQAEICLKLYKARLKDIWESELVLFVFKIFCRTSDGKSRVIRDRVVRAESVRLPISVPNKFFCDSSMDVSLGITIEAPRLTILVHVQGRKGSAFVAIAPKCRPPLTRTDPSGSVGANEIQVRELTFNALSIGTRL